MSASGVISDEELRQLAISLGLDKLAASHMDSLRQAYTYAQSILWQETEAPALADEPAHTYRASEEA